MVIATENLSIIVVVVFVVVVFIIIVVVNRNLFVFARVLPLRPTPPPPPPIINNISCRRPCSALSLPSTRIGQAGCITTCAPRPGSRSSQRQPVLPAFPYHCLLLAEPAHRHAASAADHARSASHKLPAVQDADADADADAMAVAEAVVRVAIVLLHLSPNGDTARKPGGSCGIRSRLG